MAVVGEANNGRTALELIDQLGPDVVILDNDMPERSGIDVARVLRRRSRHPAVIFHSAEDIPPEAVGLADRCLVKGTTALDLLHTVYEVATNER